MSHSVLGVRKHGQDDAIPVRLGELGASGRSNRAKRGTTFGVGLQRSGLPVMIFIGRDGDVRLVFPGEISDRDLADGLNQILPLWSK